MSRFYGKSLLAKATVFKENIISREVSKQDVEGTVMFSLCIMGYDLIIDYSLKRFIVTMYIVELMSFTNKEI